LQHQEPEGLTENFVRLLVITGEISGLDELITHESSALLYSLVPNISHRYEQLEGALFIRFSDTSLDLVLDLLFPLFSVTRETKVLLVAPQNIRPGWNSSLWQEKMQVDNLISGMVSNQNEEGSMVVGDTIGDQGRNPGV
jgi:hypothetical protein